MNHVVVRYPAFTREYIMAWPTTTDPRTNFVTVRFTDDEVADMDLHLSGSRSDAIRDAVARAVAVEQRKAARKKLVSGEEVEDLEGLEVDI